MQTKSNVSSLKWCEYYAELTQYKRLVQRTTEFIKDTLSVAGVTYVACSFGKDSSVMLHLILQQTPDILVRFASHPETRLLDNYDEVISWWRGEQNINYEEIYCEGGLVKVKNDQRNKLSQGRFDSFFVGIRAEESFGRRLSLKKHGQFHRMADGRIKICPVAWWSERDIITYIAMNGLPYLNKYGVEGFQSRTTSGIPRTHIHECLSSLKSRDIQAFNKLKMMFTDVDYFV